MTNLQVKKLEVVRESLYWSTLREYNQGLINQTTMLARLAQVSLITKKLQGK